MTDADRHRDTSSRRLTDSIFKLHADFSQMQTELRRARLEISVLRERLCRANVRRRVTHDLDLAGLRRAVAFHCHPDRGGDEATMKQVNTLFDLLEREWNGRRTRTKETKR